VKADKLKPWRFRSWITSTAINDFLQRACPILDLYERVTRGDLAPDEVVLSADEKTSIQARDRSAYGPTISGEPAHIEHSYKRRGALCLMAALNVATGRVLGSLFSTKHFTGFATFLTRTLQKVADGGARIVHLILDNGSTHRPKYLAAWMAETFPDLQVHLRWLPVKSSWLNPIEIFFSQLQCQALTPNTFPSLTALAERILAYIQYYNADCSPIRWLYTSACLRQKYAQVSEPHLLPEATATPGLS
jgi:hypothetical protein